MFKYTSKIIYKYTSKTQSAGNVFLNVS